MNIFKVCVNRFDLFLAYVVRYMANTSYVKTLSSNVSKVSSGSELFKRSAEGCDRARSLKEVERKLLNELMRNSRKSDRELAKRIGVSQPTVSRLIKKMQKDSGLTFTATTDLSKAGFEILALTFGRKEEKPMEPQKIQEYLEEYRNSIIFASTGTSSGINADRLTISVHRTYSDYARFIRYLKTAWKGLVLVGDSFLISLSSDKIIKPLSTQDLFKISEE